MVCMGPEMGHAEPLAGKFVEAIVVALREQGIDRPDGYMFKLDKKWDAEVEKIRTALIRLVELDAANKF
jgi:hypothetical protein